MPVFFVYVHDGGTYSMDDMECSPNAEVVRRQLASRVKTGKGKSRFVNDLDEITPETVRQAWEENEWPDATDDACMVVWRASHWEVPTGHPDEIWLFSGNTGRPEIIPAVLPEKEPVPTTPMRVSEAVFQRRLSMGWDRELARTTPLGHRVGSVQDRFGSNMRNQGSGIEGSTRYTGGKAAEVHTAFGLTRSIAEWHDLTRISENALRVGAKKHGMEEYLRRRQWHPRRGMS